MDTVFGIFGLIMATLACVWMIGHMYIKTRIKLLQGLQAKFSEAQARELFNSALNMELKLRREEDERKEVLQKRKARKQAAKKSKLSLVKG